jgi:hypothetical protein
MAGPGQLERKRGVEDQHRFTASRLNSTGRFLIPRKVSHPAFSSPPHNVIAISQKTRSHSLSDLCICPTILLLLHDASKKTTLALLSIRGRWQATRHRAFVRFDREHRIHCLFGAKCIHATGITEDYKSEDTHTVDRCRIGKLEPRNILWLRA